ncbi:hypothetical protein HVA01_30800 [Halovibrio variabilis]|uniref:Transposase n=1 Tax=Halovibrio variabilis TaxID=31910 RepID=A0A511US53_9GAMM|nr:hypothetical protein [Halovibrio variabilis]GEN29434.1 hypothetical protein HVA01_30800 [Halovibrio variabilis]
MLAERIKQWPERWEEKGRQEGRKEGQLEAKQSTARNLLALGVLTKEQIAEATGLSVEDVAQLQADLKR